MANSKLYSRGEAMTVVVVILVVALIGALGFIVWQNFVKKDDSQTQQEGSAKIQPTTKDEKTYSYVDLRTDKKDGTGVMIETATDVDTQLSAASDKLKAYLKDRITNPEVGMGGQAVQITIDRIYGDYAAGSFGHNAYEIVGPKDGVGAIESVAGTQNIGMPYDELVKAKVPKELVDSRALRDGEVVVYTDF